MKTVIYLDELLLTNFLAAAALLLGAGLLCARQCSGLRLMAGSAAAAAASLGILLPELPGPAAFLYKVFTCCAAVAAAYGVPGLRNFVQLCVWYLLLNLLLCGAVLLPGVQSANLCVYLPLSPGRLLLCCGAVLAVLRGVLFCFGRAGTRCFAAVLELEGAVLSVQAFCDTGFSVQDPLTGQAVVLVYYPAVRSALPQELRTFLDRYFACGTAPPPELRVRLVPCTTIAGHCVLPAVPAKALRTSKGSAAGILAAFCRQAEGVRAALERNGVECTLEARDATFGGSKMAERWNFIHKKNDAPLNSEAERWRKAMEEGMSILPLSDYKGEPLYKIVFIADHESDLAEAKQLYADQFVFCESKLDRLTDGFVNGELINRKFDKGTGIKAVCDYLGCTLADTIGFGDSDNDLQMTDVVGISVCMANGSENLKKRCDRIAPSVYEDGIAKEFKALGLI